MSFVSMSDGSPMDSESYLDLAGPAWRKRLREARDAAPPPLDVARGLPLRVDPAGPAQFVDTPEGMRRLVTIARQQPLAAYGLDFEYRFARPSVHIRRWCRRDITWDDPRSIVPLLAGVTLLCTVDDRSLSLLRFVVDVRRPEVAAGLRDLLVLPVPMIAHFARGDLYCLWQLGLPSPYRVWDTWVAQRASLLGKYHGRYAAQSTDDEDESVDVQREAACDLLAVCRRFDVVHPFADSKDDLQRSFLVHPDGAAFSREQVAYAGADADAVARIYLPQVGQAAATNALQHLVEVEMPWAVTNARIGWDGVHVDPQRLERVLVATRGHVATVRQRLDVLGVPKVLSHPRLIAYFEAQGLLHHFREGKKYTFDDDHLEKAEPLHPAIADIRLARRLDRMLADKLFAGELVGADGRLHPEHRQLGTESSRNSMRHPNIGGIGKALRPLVTPQHDTHVIGEVDLSQIEIGIAAAVFRDQDLIGMFNSGDVYSRLARGYYRDRLTDEELALPDGEFKRRFRDLRARMKVFALAIIYNITPVGLAVQLGISEREAAAERERFLGLMPSLGPVLEEAAACGAIRGYAEICTGLRRYRGRTGRPSMWETNWMRNTPVQGSAAVVFKLAGIRLARRYAHYDARLVLPLHDAFVFEAPREHLGEVAVVTGEVMRSTVQETFPVLRPQVEINVDDPSCWNKDGRSESLEAWCHDPRVAAALFGG